MKTTNLLLLLLFHQVCGLDRKNQSLIPFALKAILRELVKSSPEIEISCFGEKQKSEKLINQLLRNLSDSILFSVPKANERANKLSKSSILLFDSAAEYRKVSPGIMWQSNENVRHKHLVSFPNARVRDIANVQDGFDIDNVNFLIDESDISVKLVTSFMFTRRECRSNQFVTINSFKRDTMRWETSTFYPDKYRNFHGCKLKVFSYHDNIFGKVVAAMSHSLNFTVQNGEIKEKTDLIADGGPLSIVKNQCMLTSYPFVFTSLEFFIPPGDLFTPLEKIFLPFEFDVWIAILVTLLVGLFAIRIISWSKVYVQKFVFGRDIKSPTLNLVSIFLNGAQTKVPGRNFSRFLLTLFVIWCLIIRTCYQSQLFEFLQSDQRKPQIKTIDELFVRNFTFYGTDGGILQNITERIFDASKLDPMFR